MQNDNEKTYIWIRPTSLKTTSSTPLKSQARGAPSEGEEWGWSPAYYVQDSSDNTQSKHVYTILSLDGGLDGGEEIAVDATRTSLLLERGEMVLANEWEEGDFTSHLLGGDDEASYNYDDTSDEEEEKPHIGEVEAFDEPTKDVPPDNLIELTHLHEPSVVHALRYRYRSNGMEGIYTDTGPILLAVNPFKPDATGELYGDKAVERYKSQGEREWIAKRHEEAGRRGNEEEEKALGPHVYAVADRTFRTMMSRLFPPPTHNKTSTKDLIMNQSVLVSGESGAGKTVTTKLLMGYLAKLSRNTTPANEKERRASKVEMTVERRVLESNPIMESFGNARTVRNDNSSRFGKYIEMKFVGSSGGGSNTSGSGSGSSTSGAAGGASEDNPKAILTGASIETYLLEKVRLVHQSPGERNYHIFYELFSLNDNDSEDHDFLIDRQDGMTQSSFVEKLGLAQYEMEEFNLINASGTFDRRDGVQDSETFSDLTRAMSIMGFTPDQQMDILSVTAGLLHASNLTFRKVGEIECELEEGEHLGYVCDLLGITWEGLNRAICYHEISVRGEIHRKVLSKDQASRGIEALIKATYSTMFNYLVNRINASVSAGVSKGGKKGALNASIGILDIFGFESFETNSFEQLCINYTNEALQQQFNRFVLRNEQDEYEREGIPWSFIEFPENQDVLDLIDSKGKGIINMLHDQCRTPGATDKSFANMIYSEHTSHPRFEADGRLTAQQMFGLHHYAGMVEYTIDGFMEKNRDELPKSGADLLMSSENAFVKTIAEMINPSGQAALEKKPSRGKANNQRPTVGIQFSAQLHELRRKIDETLPHYIRCLKPNYQLVPDVFDAALIADQLRCAGVIEAVRVSRLGYPQRYPHSAFINRYRALGMKALSKKKMADRKYNPAKALVHTIAKQIKKDEGESTDIGIQVGKTKIFMKSQSFDMLERLRTEKIANSSVCIQSYGRRSIYLNRYKKSQSSILTIQCFIRRIRAKLIVEEMRRQYNSIIIQKTWRTYSATKLFKSTKIIAVWLQVHHRGNVGRAKYNKLNQERRALQLQTHIRKFVARKKFMRIVYSALVIQCARRCQLSRRVLSGKKAEARDLNAAVHERDRLRIEMIALKADLKKAKEQAKPENVSPSEEMLQQMKGKDEEIERLKLEVQRLNEEQTSKETELVRVKEELSAITSSRDDALSQVETLERKNSELQEEINDALKQLASTPAPQDMAPPTPVSTPLLNNVPPTPVTAEVECALEKALAKISELEKANAKLSEENESLLTNQLVEKKSYGSEIAKSSIDIPTLPLTSITTTATTENMTADTDEELAKLREENEVLRTQLELLRDNQDALPDIIGSDQEYEESVDPSDSESDEEDGDSDEGDESSGRLSGNLPEHIMKRICAEVEEATEEVIVKTRAESEERITKLENEIAELEQRIEDMKKSAKYEKDDMVRANRSLHQELDDAKEEISELEAELEAKTDEFDALNEDVERFAETFASQHEEVRKLERQNRRLLDENNNLKLLDDANRNKIRELQKEVKEKGDSTGTPDKQSQMMWKELAKMRKEIAQMHQYPDNTGRAARRQSTQESCSELSSDDEDDEEYEEEYQSDEYEES